MGQKIELVLGVDKKINGKNLKAGHVLATAELCAGVSIRDMNHCLGLIQVTAGAPVVEEVPEKKNKSEKTKDQDKK